LVAQSQYTSSFRAPLDQIEEQIRILKGQLEAEIQNVVRLGGGDLATQQSLVSQLIQGEAEVAALQARVRQSQSELRTAERELQRIPARQVNLARLQRQVEVAQNIYSELLRQSQEVEVGRVMALGNTDVVESAAAPLLPVRPNVPLNLTLGLLLGIAVGVGAALLQEQLDDTVREEEDITRFADAPILGVVPMFEGQDPVALLPARQSRGRAIDAYRGLRVNLGFVTSGSGGRAVLVTSPGPQEGKTTTAVNLAIAAAQSGRRVVLVDSDMRRPAMHRLFTLNGLKGLSDVLAGQASPSDAVQGVEDAGLRLLSSGTRAPNPTDLLDSAAMRSLVDELRKQADLVIFDSPPLLSAADALVLASMSDAVLMVCIPGFSHRRALQRARVLLNQIGRDVSGVVLNRVQRRAGYGYYYGYYHYYYSDQQADGEGGETQSRRRHRSRSRRV
jgi:capsular exopolysaccharide synthesis family protein